ncbi:hypothetical protein [Sphaerisporangium aureirubrum]|uniref:Uncharacterized protein n=1 Tax=Sphaerisporangium aureirubrum TaxID=1544736 RepID=A0ABW1NTG1_9ACTN
MFFDARGQERVLRVTWHEGTLVLSLWRGEMCTASFRMPMEDVGRLLDTLDVGYSEAGGQYAEDDYPQEDYADDGERYAGEDAEPEEYADYADYPGTGQYARPPRGEAARAAALGPKDVLVARGSTSDRLVASQGAPAHQLPPMPSTGAQAVPPAPAYPPRDPAYAADAREAAYPADAREAAYPPGAREAAYPVDAREAAYAADGREAPYAADGRPVPARPGDQWSPAGVPADQVAHPDFTPPSGFTLAEPAAEPSRPRRRTAAEGEFPPRSGRGDHATGPAAGHGVPAQYGAPSAEYGAQGGVPQYAAPGSAPEYAAPSGRAPEYAGPSGQAPEYATPSGQAAEYGAPSGQAAEYGAPGEYAPPAGYGGQPPGYGIPPAGDYGPDGYGPSRTYGTPAEQGPGDADGFGRPHEGGYTTPPLDYSAPPDYRSAPEYEPGYGSAPGYPPEYGSAPDYGTTQRYTPDYTASPEYGSAPEYRAPAPEYGPPPGYPPGPGYGTASEFPQGAEYGRYQDAVPRENMIVNDALPFDPRQPADPSSYPPRVPPQSAVDPADPLGLGSMAPPPDSTDPQLSRPYVHEPMFSTGERVRPDGQPYHPEDAGRYPDERPYPQEKRDW